MDPRSSADLTLTNHHKDTRASCNSYETSASSKAFYRNRSNMKSKVSLKIDMLDSEEYFENTKSLRAIQEKEENLSDMQFFKEEFPNLNIKIFLSLTFANDELNTDLNIKISENLKVYELICIAVDKFNESFNENGTKLMLKRNFSNYDIRPSKKNGKPKMDLPAISSDVYVRDIYMTQFSLMYKPEDVILLKPEKIGLCKRCVIM